MLPLLTYSLPFFISLAFFAMLFPFLLVLAEVSDEGRSGNMIEGRGRKQQAKQIRARAKRAAPKIAAEVAESIKTGKKGYRQAREVAQKHASKAREKVVPPDLDAYTRQTVKLIHRVLTTSDLVARLNRIDQYKKYLVESPEGQWARKDLVENLDLLSKRAKERADGFRFVATPTKRKQLSA